MNIGADWIARPDAAAQQYRIPLRGVGGEPLALAEGDTFTAEVTDAKPDGTLTLKMPNSQPFLAELLADRPMVPGQRITLTVTAVRDGVPMVEIAGEGASSADTFLKAMGAPRNDLTLALAREALRQQTPFTPKQFAALTRTAAAFDVTPEQAVFMTRHKIPVTQENIAQYRALNQPEAQLGALLQKMLNLLPPERPLPQPVQTAQTVQTVQTAPTDGAPPQQPTPPAQPVQIPQPVQPDGEPPPLQSQQPTAQPQAAAPSPPPAPEAAAPTVTQSPPPPQSSPLQPQPAQIQQPAQPDGEPPPLQSQQPTAQPQAAATPPPPAPEAAAPTATQSPPSPQPSPLQPQPAQIQQPAQPNGDPPPPQPTVQLQAAAPPPPPAPQSQPQATVPPPSPVPPPVQTPPAETVRQTVPREPATQPTAAPSATPSPPPPQPHPLQPQPTHTPPEPPVPEQPPPIRELLDALFARVMPDRSRELPRELDAPKQTRELGQLLTRVLDMARELPEQPRGELTRAVRDVVENLRFSEQINHCTSFMQIPLAINGERTTAQLYIFNDSREKKRIDPGNATIFVSLTTANLGTVEGFVKVIGAGVEADFALQTEEAARLFRAGLPELGALLEAQGYRLERVNAAAAKTEPASPAAVERGRAVRAERYRFNRTV